MSLARCHVIIGANGVVLGADGDASGWIGRSLTAHNDVPVAVRTAAVNVIALVRNPAMRMSAASTTVAGSPELEITAIEAMPVRRTEVAIGPLIESAIEPLREQARAADIALRLEVPKDVPSFVAIDPEKLAWAVSMLVGNALRHVRHGTRSRPGGSVLVRVATDSVREGITVSVSDDGRGIPKEKLPWLFARPPGSPRPLGLGLIVMRDVVTAHGGDVSVESSSDGTTFTLFLPFC